jgi:AcrR family transcriptional regulator
MTVNRNTTPGTDTGKPLGRRERNKVEKLARIKIAAHKLFVRYGYEETTTARIAEEADIGMGTLFSYAKDKRDLLFLIFNDSFEPALDTMEASLDERDALVPALLKLFRPLYNYHRLEPKLSRAILRELNFADDGRQSERFRINSARIMALIGNIIATAQTKSEVGRHFDRMLGAWVVFAAYQAEIRRHMTSDTEDVEEGLASLAESLGLLVRGLAPEASARSHRAGK